MLLLLPSWFPLAAMIGNILPSEAVVSCQSLNQFCHWLSESLSVISPPKSTALGFNLATNRLAFCLGVLLCLRLQDPSAHVHVLFFQQNYSSGETSFNLPWQGFWAGSRIHIFMIPKLKLKISLSMEIFFHWNHSSTKIILPLKPSSIFQKRPWKE